MSRKIDALDKRIQDAYMNNVVVRHCLDIWISGQWSYQKAIEEAMLCLVDERQMLHAIAVNAMMTQPAPIIIKQWSDNRTEDTEGRGE